MLFDDEGSPVGFAQCQLRRDCVEGTSTSPLGYLEGIYIDEARRRRRCGRTLLAACEKWAAECGCTEFASDCKLGNDESLAFHLSAGLVEAARVVCFAKRLARP
nr:GNAT family N-acetyltransferase [Gordonibacter sp. An230]